MEDLVELWTMVLVLKVDCEGQRNHLIDVDVFLLAVSFHVEEKLVLRRQGLMPLNVVDQLFVAELAQALVIYPCRRRLPLKVKQVRRVCLLPRGVAFSDFRVALSDLRVETDSDICTARLATLHWVCLTLSELVRGRGRCIGLRHVACQSALHDPPDDVAVVAFEDHEFERCKLAWFIVVRRYLSVLAVGVSTCL